MIVRDWKQAWDFGKDFAQQGMKGVNAFYALPYWEDLLINHLLDPMHCFKNVAVVVWQHMCGQKDNHNSRVDLKEANTMRRCWPRENESLPDAPWILSKEERSVLKRVIETLRTPTGTMHSLKGAFTSAKKKKN